MKRQHISYYIITILTAVIGTALTSCRDDIDMPGAGEYVEPGLPATVSLRFDIPDMPVQSRALTDAQESRVNDLWIALYDAEPGANHGRLKNKYYISRDNEEGYHQIRNLTIENLRTTSGRCYLVAAANVGNNYGVSSDPTIWDGSDMHTTLHEMLDRAETLDQFKSIAAALGSTLQTDYAAANLVMGGSYLYNSDTSDGDIQHKPDYDWSRIPIITIPAGDVTLTSGKIHLRRLVAKVTFNIYAGAGITVRPTHWRLVNNPRFCYVQDQDGNAGEAVTVHLKDGDNSNYGNSDPETEVELASASSGNAEHHTFTFYTYENKHNAREGAGLTDYFDREKEYKTANVPGSDGKDHHENTGVYTALCADARTPDLKTGVNVNNFATIVEITCDVQYQVTIDGQTVQRTGTAIYTVHLGYMNRDVNDFNVRRNHKYIYTMTVLGLNQIKIEAEDDTGVEDYPGIEGTVTDAMARMITVDAHYAAFNIQLSNSERSRLRYLIEAPYGNDVKTYDSGDVSDRNTPPADNNEYFNWIRIKPTTGENILAEYKTGANDEPWYLHDLIEVNGNNLVHPGLTVNRRGAVTNAPTTISGTDGTTQRWYTVFLNENVYDVDGVDKHPLSDWVNYVNKDMRTVLFMVLNIAVSPDEDSRYGRGKYLFRQRSIQTYYTTDVSAYGRNAPTAVGVEHVNESYGKRLDWQWSAKNSDLDYSNGRWNQWKFLCNAGNSTNNPSGWTTEATRYWYCSDTPSGTNSFGLLRYVNGANGSNATSRTGYIKTDEDGYPVPAVVYYSSPSTNNRTQDPSGAVSGYYEAMTLCMNRNRDLDGDGRISPDEVRWYLPSQGKYERIMLGRNSLTTSLFSAVAGTYYCNPNDPVAVANNNFGYTGTLRSNGRNNQLNFVTSNHMKFYSDEGGSYHTDLGIYWNDNGNSAWSMYPWNIRCVRNLGVDLSTITTTDPVGKAYEVTKENEYTVFNQRYYYGRSLRAAVIDDYLWVHTVADTEQNKVARKFMAATKDMEVSIPATVSDKTYSTFQEAFDDNYPCRDYSTTEVWRAPNQRELMMMMSEIGLNGGTYSCTQEAFPRGGRYAAISGSQLVMANPTGTLRVRCVRDIE